MSSTKLENDKYYTPIDLVKYCIDKTFEIIGKENIDDLTLKNNIEEVGLW